MAFKSVNFLSCETTDLKAINLYLKLTLVFVVHTIDLEFRHTRS